MGEVVVLRDVLEEQLARELGVSLPFLRTCAHARIPAHQAKAILRWFLQQPPRERAIIMKNVLGPTRTERRERRR